MLPKLYMSIRVLNILKRYRKRAKIASNQHSLKLGRPRMTWRCTVEAAGTEATAMGHSCGTLRTLAQDGLRWREFVAALVVYDKKGSQ